MSVVTRILLVIALMFSVLSTVQARTPVPIINHENVVWTRPDNKALDLSEVKNRIIKAGQEKSWAIVSGPTENSLIGTLVVRGKHTVRVSISFSATAFSVKYLDSINMSYAAPGSGTGADNQGSSSTVGVIHPFYNRWSQDLVSSIRSQLQM